MGDDMLILKKSVMVVLFILGTKRWPRKTGHWLKWISS